MFFHSLTIKEERIAVPEVQQSRESPDPVSLCQRWILNLDHVDSINVTLVVDVFQLFQDYVTGPTVRLVWKKGRRG